MAGQEQTRRECFGSAVAASLLAVNSAVPAPARADVRDDLARIEAEEARRRKKTTEATPMMARLREAFPGAIPNDLLLERLGRRLATHGFSADTTLVASSLCSDEVNRPLEEACRRYYGDRYFSMGGLAGFPFAGVTGFGAMASHIPDGGNCILVYGPHVGIDSQGNVGKVDRRGKKASGTCCGSAVAASKALVDVVSGEIDISGGYLPSRVSVYDAQQSYVTNFLLPYCAEINSAKDPMVSLPYIAFKPIDNQWNKILAQTSSSVGPDGKIAMLGGLQVRRGCGGSALSLLARESDCFLLFSLQINTSGDQSDYFLPLRFDLRDSNNNIKEDLLLELYTGFARTPAGVRPDMQ